MTALDPRPTVDAPDDDPYLWLEDLDSPRVLEWVDTQNAATLGRFESPRVAVDRQTLKSIFDRPDNIPFPNRRGGRLFNPWRDAANPRGLWRVTTLASYLSERPEWDVLIDVDALAAAEGEDWAWRGAMTLPGTLDRAIVHLSRGGSDAQVLREFDMNKREFVSDGFNFPEAKGGVSWLDRDALLLFSPLGDGMATKGGFARTIRLWRRGEDPLYAPVLFETSEDSFGVWAYRDPDETKERIWFIEKPGMIETHVWVGDRTGPKTRLDLPSDCWMQSDRGWLAVKPRHPWEIEGKTYAADSVIVIELDAFLSGDRNFTTVFEPGERRALQGFFWAGGRLVLAIFDNLKPVFETVTPSEGRLAKAMITGLPSLGSAYVFPFDVHPEESQGDLLGFANDPVTPPTLFLLEPGNPPQVMKRAPEAFDATGLVVTRHEAVSSDGVHIPYVQVGPPGENGESYVHMYGYGGFGASMSPSYNSALGKLWLERGGTSVLAHLRGGREFGIAWEEAGRREGKRLSHDDFAAVAADLVRRGVTTPQRIAAEGGSNGGLLIANMLTRYPERFGALFCTVPVIDMRRSAKLLAGNVWIDEYGDPDNPADWAFLSAMSAYHTAKPGQPYPPILLATSRAMTACIPVMRARWRPSFKLWAMPPIFTNSRRADTATARITRTWPPSSLWAIPSYASRLGGLQSECNGASAPLHDIGTKPDTGPSRRRSKARDRRGDEVEPIPEWVPRLLQTASP